MEKSPNYKEAIRRVENGEIELGEPVDGAN